MSQRVANALSRLRDSTVKRYVVVTVSALLLLFVAPPLSVEVAAWFAPLPAELEPAPATLFKATRVRDRGGVLLAAVRVDGKHILPVTYEQLPKHVVDTLLAAEDKRFFSHRGVDWLAVARASLQWVWARKVVSGASTLTQQLARSTFARERNLRGKWQEMVLARRIERTLSKVQIFEAYVNHIEFGPNVVGIGAAADVYFAKPISALSLSEAATLVGIPRGPSLYDPKRPHSPIKKRRDRILTRLEENLPDYATQVSDAIGMPLELQEQWVAPGAFHWVRRLMAGEVDEFSRSEITTTLDSALQRRVETLVLQHSSTMLRFGASSAAVLVSDNQTQEVLAYVGSPDYRAATSGGQNDGVVASRQPGSTLKPFVYAAAMQHLGYTTATLLPDVPLEFREAGKVYSPRNYDGHFHGPVRLREALANSLNVPAVYTASQVGVGTVLRELHRFGFDSLEKAPEHYGVALALGDGEVTLEELVAAYMAIPNGGIFYPLRVRRNETRGEPVRAASSAIARLIRDVLEDPLARATSFGRHGVLEFEFPVGVKTGTSKGARDNWTLGFSDQVTVGVWVGNFDGSPMTGASGVSGAGPLFHSVLREATNWVKTRERSKTDTSVPSANPASPLEISRAPAPELTRVEVCALSGKLPTQFCNAKLTELFIPGTEPTARDDMHVAVPILNGAIAPGCPGATVQIVESYPTQYETWAKQAGRPLLPRYTLQNCETPVAGEAGASGAEVLFPRDGAEYRLVEDEPLARQQLLLRGRTGAGSLTFVIDEVPFRTVTSPFEAEWPLTRGEHQVQVITPDGQRSRVVRFRVR